MNDTKKLLSNSVIVFVGTLVASVFSYLFNMMMGRMLGPSGYGDMTAVLSASTIILVGGGAVITIVMRYSSELYATKNTTALSKLLKVFSRAMLSFGILIFLLVVALAQPIANFFTISKGIYIVIGFSSVIVGFLIAVNRGFLQGVQSFKPLTIVNISEMIIRFALGIIIVKLGFGAGGALAATVIATICAYLFSFPPVSKVLSEKGKEDTNFRFDKREILNFSVPAFVGALLVALSLNVDILLVKHFFNPSDAGIYAAVSTIGKIIIYLVSPIIAVMFPMITEKKTRGEKHYKTLLLALFVTALAALLILAIYAIAPSMVIRILYGTKFTSFYYLLPEVGLSMVFYALVNLLCNYFIAVKDFVFIAIYSLVIIGQVSIVTTYHPSLTMVVREFILGNGLLFALLSAYYLFTKKTQLLAMIRKQYE